MQTNLDLEPREAKMLDVSTKKQHTLLTVFVATSNEICLPFPICSYDLSTTQNTLSDKDLANH